MPILKNDLDLFRYKIILKILTRKRKVRGSPCTQNGPTFPYFHNGQVHGLLHNGHNLTYHTLHKSRSTLWHHNLKTKYFSKQNIENKQIKKSKKSQSKPWMTKVRTSSRHLLAEIRAIHGIWYTSIFLGIIFFVKIEN